MKSLKKKKLYHVSPIENRISIMKYGLIDDVREMGIYFSDNDDSSVEWVMKRTEGMNGFRPKQLLLCTVEFNENDPKLFRSSKGKGIEDTWIECNSYFYQNHITPNKIFFELVEIQNENEWDYYEIENNINPEEITPEVIKSYFEKKPRNILGMKIDNNGKFFPIRLGKNLSENKDYKTFFESGLNRKIGMINHGYLKDELTKNENIRMLNHKIKILPIYSVLGMVG